MLAIAESIMNEARLRVQREYGHEIGLPASEITTPALVLDLPVARRNIATMAERMGQCSSVLRPHIKAHKSPDLAAIQAESGVAGWSVATVWEAVTMAAAGFDGIFVVNTIVGRPQMEVLAELSRDRDVSVAVDDLLNAQALSSLAVEKGSRIGVLLEVDTGMDRAGVDTAQEALELSRAIVHLPGLEFEGLTGYEGQCSGVVDPEERRRKHQAAMGTFASVADELVSEGIPIGIRSAGGTTTWEWTASYPGITEIQAGTYVVMDNFHGRMVPDFEKALTVATTVISRRPDRVVVDAGNKTVAVSHLATVRGFEDLPFVRFDEEHGVFGTGHDPPPLGARLEIVPGYAPSTVNAFDAFHVVEGGVVIDIWPVVPRGPGHHGLAGRTRG